MATEIEFYFDFSSTYSYLALEATEAVAGRHAVKLSWKPIALGAIFKQLGHAPPPADTVKGRYLQHDVQRCAEAAGLPFNWPAPFPFNSIPAARGFYWIESSDPKMAVRYAKRVFNAAFGEGLDCSDTETLASVAESLNLDVEAYLAGIRTDQMKMQLIQETNRAAERGVFGAPTFFVGDEMFWGADRIGQLDSYLGQLA